jgi:hypothetical protein
MTETTPVSMMTRRKLLTRDLKAICAMAMVPIAEQMIFPQAASAHEHKSGSDFWGFGSHRGSDLYHDHDWAWGGDEFHGRDHDHDRGEGKHGGTGGARGGHTGNCFLKGTRILTATGERKIEDLVPGDLVKTAFGETRPVQSIGRFRRVRSVANKPWAKHARPVRIARSALAHEVPHRDLYITQGHAVLFEDILIPAGSLINGTTISLYAADEHDELVFFHLKLETHDVIYAEGAPCETLLSVDSSVSNSPNTIAREPHCAPIICNGLHSELKIRLRGLMSPWLGSHKFDDIRTHLELRAVSLGAAQHSWL